MYRRCPCCGSYLDPGERCDCSIEKAASRISTPKGGTVMGKLSRKAIVRPGKEKVK